MGAARKAAGLWHFLAYRPAEAQTQEQSWLLSTLGSTRSATKPAALCRRRLRQDYWQRQCRDGRGGRVLLRKASFLHPHWSHAAGGNGQTNYLSTGRCNEGASSGLAKEERSVAKHRANQENSTKVYASRSTEPTTHDKGLRQVDAI